MRTLSYRKVVILIAALRHSRTLYGEEWNFAARVITRLRKYNCLKAIKSTPYGASFARLVHDRHWNTFFYVYLFSDQHFCWQQTHACPIAAYFSISHQFISIEFELSSNMAAELFELGLKTYIWIYIYIYIIKNCLKTLFINVSGTYRYALSFFIELCL